MVKHGGGLIGDRELNVPTSQASMRNEFGC